MKAKVLKKSILCCMIVSVLALGLGALTFAVEYIDVGPADVYPEKEFVLDWLDQPRIFEKYGKISDAIWSYAELGMQEFKSSKLLADTLEEEGFKVERGMAGMPTCFVATYGSGKPVIGILAEYDALPMISQKGLVPYQDALVPGGPGHGCGHNRRGAVCAASVVAVKQAMDRYGIKGTIKYFGGPAEETLISRPYMVRAGLFDGVDAAIEPSPGTGFSTNYGLSGGCAMFSNIYEFKGVTAHSAGGPWNAKSALDGVDIMNVATNFLREHLHYGYRMHYVIPSGGEAPNVVPDYASVWYFIRNSDERLLSMVEKVNNCAKAAALATGTELTIRVYTALHQRNRNKALAVVAQQNIDLVGMPKWSDEEVAFAKALQTELGAKVVGMTTTVSKLRKYDPTVKFTGGGSSDVAEVTRVTPTTVISLPGEVPGRIGHHWSRVASTYGSASWRGINAGAKATAAMTIDLMTKPELLKKAWEEFEAFTKDNPYESYLPADAVPPVELNAELMEKYRPRLEPTYREP